MSKIMLKDGERYQKTISSPGLSAGTIIEIAGTHELDSEWIPIPIRIVGKKVNDQPFSTNFYSLRRNYERLNR